MLPLMQGAYARCEPMGLLDSELPEAPLPAGYNPYFDLPPAG